MSRRSEQAAALAAVYDQIPAIDCLGLCHRSCGPIRMTQLEHDTIQQRHGVDIPQTGMATCPALTILNRCAVHPDRPVVCRLWGIVDSLPCPHGCRPATTLTDRHGYDLLAQAADIDGDRAAGRRFRGGVK